MISENDMAIFSGGELVKPLSDSLMRIKKIVQDREDCPKDEAVKVQLAAGELVTVLVSNCKAPNPFHEEDGYAKILHMDSGDVYYARQEQLSPI